MKALSIAVTLLCALTSLLLAWLADAVLVAVLGDELP